MIRQAIVYLATGRDAPAALPDVAGLPVAVRVVVAAVRAGVERVFVPDSWRGTGLERALDRRPTARAAVVWLEGGEPAPAGPALLLPATVLVGAPSLAVIRAAAPPAVLVESESLGAPVVAADASLLGPLWPLAARGRPLGDAVAHEVGARVAARVRGEGWAVRVTDAASAARAAARLEMGLGSPSDTRLDRALNRRLSRPLTRWAIAAGIGPNPVSVASLGVGLAAAACVTSATATGALAGLLLYVTSVVLDHVDGEVARLGLLESRLGEWLDVAVDTVVHTLLVVAMGFAAQQAAGGHAAVLGLVAAAGVGSSAAVTKSAAQDGTGRGIGALLDALGGRDGFYVMLLLFTAGLLFLPALLPALMVLVAVGSHAYWLGRGLYRLARRLRLATPARPGTVGPAPEGGASADPAPNRLR